MALNVIRVTIVPFQCNRFCRKSLSAVCTISYALFSEIIIWFFQGSPVFAKTSELKLPSSGQSVTYLIWTRAGSLEWCLLTIAKHFTLSTMNYYWRNWRHMASLIRSFFILFNNDIFNFILFNNDPPVHVSSQVDLYADDNLNLNFH